MITKEEFKTVCKKNGLTSGINMPSIVDYVCGKAVVCRYMTGGHFASGSEAKVFVWIHAKRAGFSNSICFFDAQMPNTTNELQKYIVMALSSYKEELKNIRKQRIEAI